MAELLSGWQGIAGTAIIISIMLAGIALGLGRAFSIKRLERFGADEIIQSIINAAILGFAVTLSTIVIQVGAEFTPHFQNITCMSNATPTDYSLCGINATTQSAFSLSQDLVRINNILGYYQTLDLKFGNFSIQPLENLQGVSTQLSNALYSIQLSVFASALNAQFLSFVSSNWFGAIFATGLVLRSFFLSRSFGAFLIAASISLIIFYPLMLLMFPLPLAQITAAETQAQSFLSNAAYQTVPIVDLNDNNAIAERIYAMGFLPPNATNSTGADLTGDLTLLVQSVTIAAADLLFYSLVVPLLALIATLVLIKELSQSFAGEIATEVSYL